jgi:hypothetical protein
LDGRGAIHPHKKGMSKKTVADTSRLLSFTLVGSLAEMDNASPKDKRLPAEASVDRVWKSGASRLMRLI